MFTTLPCEGNPSYQTKVPAPVPFNDDSVTLCPTHIAGGVLTVKLIVGIAKVKVTTASQPTPSATVTE